MTQITETGRLPEIAIPASGVVDYVEARGAVPAHIAVFARPADAEPAFTITLTGSPRDREQMAATLAEYFSSMESAARDAAVLAGVR